MDFSLSVERINSALKKEDVQLRPKEAKLLKIKFIHNYDFCSMYDRPCNGPNSLYTESFLLKIIFNKNRLAVCLE